MVIHQDKRGSPLRYTPFDVDLDEVTETHIAGLREVAEGWSVEYKSIVPMPKDLAKSLSSFANRYGGWLFLGIQEDSTDNTAASFPGIPDSDVTSAVQRVRDAAKDLLQPTVPFIHRTLSGPLATISLPTGYSIIVIRIPEGATPPYMHNDGRVYVRTGDSSSPVPATDRTTLDLLHRKAAEKSNLLIDLIDRRPQVSQGEDETPYLHLVICSDPFRVLNHWYSGSFAEFSNIMSAGPLPFDNLYASQNGFVARQAKNNDRYSRLFTWEFSRTCNSFVTLPLPILPTPHLDGRYYGTEDWKQFDCGEPFGAMLAKAELRPNNILNLNILISVLVGILLRHRELVGEVGISGPFYIKGVVENVWRATPFIDLREYMTHIESFDFPVVQDREVIVPVGDWPEGYITVREKSLDRDYTQAAVTMWKVIMQALGVPAEVWEESMEDIIDIATEEARRHQGRIRG